jgi:hypothetical protein
MCEKVLDEAGALLFSYPITGEIISMVDKLHLCRTCYNSILRHITDMRDLLRMVRCVE